MCGQMLQGALGCTSRVLMHHLGIVQPVDIVAHWYATAMLHCKATGQSVGTHSNASVMSAPSMDSALWHQKMYVHSTSHPGGTACCMHKHFCAQCVITW